MAAHIGIELAPGVCRIVDLDISRTKAGLVSTTVREFGVFRQASTEMTAALARLRGRAAAAVVWGAPGDHRQVMVTSGTYDAMRREATRSLAKAGVQTHGAFVDIAPVPMSGDAETARRPVVVALASGAAISTAILPLRAAAIDVKTVATPATALASLARIRRRLAPTGGRLHRPGSADRSVIVEAYAVIDETTTCIVLLREGTLIAARELGWGFHEGRRGLLRPREDVAAMFADELIEFLFASGGTLKSIQQLTLCGGAGDLRSIAALLTEQCDLEVEPLDYPHGISAEGVGHAALREHCADMWLAWAVASDQPAPLSLLHARQIQAAHIRFIRAAVAAGIMTGVGLGWQAAHSSLLRAERMQPVPTVAPEPAGPPEPRIPREVGGLRYGSDEAPR